MRWTTDNVRRSFLDFFKGKGHQIVPSASLIPKGDPTLLFTNAGMVPFKDYFLGLRTPSSLRVADCQKCLRISGKHNDLEAVGRDTYHHTFFEMLGNWSFGDYYKTEAIAWHWELIVKVWEIDPKLLYATVYKDDDEAEAIWRKMKVLPNDRMMRFDKENFWQMGETGPCGPCSEIHLDRGDQACDGKAHAGIKCAVNAEGCERFIELSNLVFIQYNRDESGKLTPLPKKHVDTGTGLERVAAVLQGLEQGQLLGNYDIDVFRQIIVKPESVLNFFERTQMGWLSLEELVMSIGVRTPYGQSSEYDIAYRAIADHARAICFLIAEGLTPSNNGPAYVLRRLIRRAALHGNQLQLSAGFLSRVCKSTIEAMAEGYPELRGHNGATEKSIIEEVQAEENGFNAQLKMGLELIKQKLLEVRQEGKRLFPGDFAFRLHDTNGLPLDLTQAVLRDQGFEVDIEEFDRLMDEQRDRGRASRRETIAGPEIQVRAGLQSRFVGYDRGEADSEVTYSSRGGETPDTAEELTSLFVRETPFYPEGGGQVGDRGVIEAAGGGALFEVTDTRKSNDAIVHIGRLLRGDAREFATGARVHLKIDTNRRRAAMLNHSATHILHYALRDGLGGGVHQAGSLVAPEKLRFDFNYTGKIAEADLQTIEEEVNARIRENAEVVTEEMAYDDAIKAGALAFFGDKYGDRVRVLRMGDFSVELCGGTHVARTGEIGVFRLDSESGVAAGVRRIEALTGQGAVESIRAREKILDQIGNQLRAKDGLALERLQRLLAREKELERKIRELEKKLASGGGEGAGADGDRVREVNGIRLVTRKLDGLDPNTMREMADRLRQKHGSAVIALGSDLGEKVALLVAVTPDLANRVKAGEIVKQIAPIVGGSGGGRPELAQAGGRDASRLQEALNKVADLLR